MALAPDPTAPSCTVTPPWQCKVTPAGLAAKGPSQAEHSSQAGTTQAGEEVPAHQYSSSGTAGDHISSIFSLIVRWFFFCISTLPTLWVCAAESLLEPSKHLGASGITALLGSTVPRDIPALLQPHLPSGHSGGPSPRGQASCSLPGLSTGHQEYLDTAASSLHPSLHHSTGRPPGSISICQLLRSVQLSNTGTLPCHPERSTSEDAPELQDLCSQGA